MFDDFRYSVRVLARDKAITAVLVLSLAVGTGANAAVYGVVNALLFRGPAAVEHPSRLVSIHTSQFNGAPYGQSSYPDYLSLKAEIRSLENIAALDDNSSDSINLGSLVRRVRVAAVSGEFFPLLRMSPHRGRLLTSDDAARGAVISFNLWTDFGQSEDLLGETLSIRGKNYSIVGITPSGFRGLQLHQTPDVWIPLDPATDTTTRGDRRLPLIGRLNRGASQPALQHELDRITVSLADRFPETNRGTLTAADEPRRMTATRYSRLDPSARPQATLISAVLLSATGLLLASACVNAGSLTLSRAADRRHAMAVKVALGASRARLLRQALTESAIVSAAGGGLGLLFAVWTVDAAPALFAPEHAELLDARLDTSIVLLTVAVSCIAGALAALAPAIHPTGTLPAAALRSDAASTTDPQGGSRVRGVLVALQVALSTVLVVATGLFIQGLTNALQADFGFAARDAAVATINSPGRTANLARGLVYQATVLERLRAMEGVEAAAWVGTLPLGRSNSQEFRIEAGDRPVSEMVELDINVTSPEYFQTMGIALLEGRFFNDGDGGRAAPVVIVNEILANRYLGGGAIGRYLHDSHETALQIVGIVQSGKYRTMQESPQPMVYYPLHQNYIPLVNLVVRTTGDPAAFSASMSALLQEIDSGVTIQRIMTLDAHLSEALVVDRLATTLVGLCGGMAMILAIIGVYGVMSDAVQRRTREIGVRVALGAAPFRIVRLVFGEALHVTAAGAVLGASAAVLIDRVTQSFLSGVPSVNAVTVLGILGALTLVIIVAAVVPTRRALRVDPAIALRRE